MSEQLELGILLAPSSSAGGSPAKISREATPGGPDWLGRAPAFGGNSLGSFAQFCPDSWLLKTFQLSLGGGFLPFSGSLPKAGTMRSGILSARRPSGRAIDVTGFSSSDGEMLPTPTASDAYGSGSRNTENSKAHFGVSLTDWAKKDDGRGRISGDRGKLSPEFVRLMMGFPAGWLCSEP